MGERSQGGNRKVGANKVYNYGEVSFKRDPQGGIKNKQKRGSVFHRKRALMSTDKKAVENCSAVGSEKGRKPEHGKRSDPPQGWGKETNRKTAGSKTAKKIFVNTKEFLKSRVVKQAQEKDLCRLGGSDHFCNMLGVKCHERSPG